MTRDPFLSVTCDKCKAPINSDTRFEYLCGHIICKLCDGGSRCRYCGHPGPAHVHSSSDAARAAAASDVCEACEDTALYYCVSCPKLLCDRCAHIHSVTPTRRNHQVVYLKDYPRQADPAEQVNYDVPEHVYLSRKRSPEGTSPGEEEDAAEASTEPTRKRPSAGLGETWDRTAELRKPFRKNIPVKQFSYSKSVSSVASERMSERSCRSEKSVGTDVSGTASMIKNNHYTIMVYSNSEGGPPSEPGLVRVIQTAPVQSSAPAAPVPVHGECHDHGVYIARAASASLSSSDSTTSFSSHTCESHNEEYTRSRSVNRHHPTRSDTMDNISDIYNSGGRGSRAVSSEASPGLVRERSPYQQAVSEQSFESGKSEGIGEVAIGGAEDQEDQEFTPVQRGVLQPTNLQPVRLLYDRDREQLSEATPKSPTTTTEELTLNVEVLKKPSHSSFSSQCSYHSLSHTSEQVNLLQSASESSRQSMVDDILERYEQSSLPKKRRTQESESSEGGEDRPCMVPQKTSDRSSPDSSSFMERVRSTSLGNSDKFIDERIYESSDGSDAVRPDVGEELEEEGEDKDGYMTHSSHYSEPDEDNLSYIEEEPEEVAAEVVEMTAVEGQDSRELEKGEELEKAEELEKSGIPGHGAMLVKQEEMEVCEADEHSDVESGEEIGFQLRLDVEDLPDADSYLVSKEIFVSTNAIPSPHFEKKMLPATEGRNRSRSSSVPTLQSKIPIARTASGQKLRRSISEESRDYSPDGKRKSISSARSRSLSKDSLTNIPIARTSSGEKLRRSLSRSSSVDSSRSSNASPSRGSLRKSSSSGSISKIPTRRRSSANGRSSRASSASPRRRSSSNESARSTSSNSKIPVLKRGNSKNSTHSNSENGVAAGKPPLPRSISRDSQSTKNPTERKTSKAGIDHPEKESHQTATWDPEKESQVESVNSRRSSVRSSQSPSRIPVRTRSMSEESLGQASVSSTNSRDSKKFAYSRRASSPGGSRIPVRTNSNEAIIEKKQLEAQSKESFSSSSSGSTVENLKKHFETLAASSTEIPEPAKLPEFGREQELLSWAPGELECESIELDVDGQYFEVSSDEEWEFPTVQSSELVAVHAAIPADQAEPYSTRPCSEGVDPNTETSSICSGSFISDNSYLRKSHPVPGERRQSRDRVESDSSGVWKRGAVEPLDLRSSSVKPHKCKYVVIGRAPREPLDDNTLHFPTMEAYRQWAANQSLSDPSLDADSFVGMYDEAGYSSGDGMLYKLVHLRSPLGLVEESIPSSEEEGSERRSILSVHTALTASAVSSGSSTSTVVDGEDGEGGPLLNQPPPPDYFDAEERSASVQSRDLPEMRRAGSQASITSSLYSAVSKDLGHYVDMFNSQMQPGQQPDLALDGERFNRKYSKRVSALRPGKQQQYPRVEGRGAASTLPRDRKSTHSSEERVKLTYTLPRKTKEHGTLTPNFHVPTKDHGTLTPSFHNQTYAGRGTSPKSNDPRLLSRSLTFGTPSDYRKFEEEDWMRSLPRHLGRKPYLRSPSMRPVDWSVMGRKGTEPGFLMNPTGIAVDEQCVAICEEGNSRVQIFIEDESEYCINSLTNPCGIAMSHDNIFVSDTDKHVVKVYGRSALEVAVLGGPGTSKGRFREPRGIAFNPANGDLAVCDTENHRVQVFDVEGNLIKCIGTKGKERGNFKEPISCAYDKWGRLLVSDHCNYRVQIFDSHYQYITDFGKYGKSSGEFWGVNGLCSHVNGDILVVDSDNNCLSVHSSDGRFISVFGRKGAERWEFLYPHSVATDEVGNVFVSDWGNHRIHIMDKKLLPYLEKESHML